MNYPDLVGRTDNLIRHQVNSPEEHNEAKLELVIMVNHVWGQTKCRLEDFRFMTFTLALNEVNNLLMPIFLKRVSAFGLTYQSEYDDDNRVACIHLFRKVFGANGLQTGNRLEQTYLGLHSATETAFTIALIHYFNEYKH